MTSLAEVWLWGSRIGAVALEPGSPVASFEYDPEFLTSGIQLSPLHLRLSPGVHAFPNLPQAEYGGLPGLLADALPGRFASTLIDAWLLARGQEPGSLNAVERLLLVGANGTGALEFRPASEGPTPCKPALDLSALARMADRVLQLGSRAAQGIVEAAEHTAFAHLLFVACRTQGAAPTAHVDLHQTTGELRASQDLLRAGFEACVLELDPLEPCADGPNTPRGMAALGHAYAMAARAAGIEVAETRLTGSAHRRHLLTRRLDRSASGKAHLHGHSTMTHADPRAESSAEELFQVPHQLGLDQATIEQMYARVLFQLLAHDRNASALDFAYTMDRRGRWGLAPASGLAYSASPDRTPNAARMALGGKRSDFTTPDLGQLAAQVSLQRGRALRIARQVRAALLRWPEFAREAGLGAEWTDRVQQGLLLDLIPG